MQKQYLKYMMERKQISIYLNLKRFTSPQTCMAKFVRMCKIYVHFTVWFVIFAPRPRLKFCFIVLHEPVTYRRCIFYLWMSMILLTDHSDHKEMPFIGRAWFVFTLQPLWTYIYIIKCILSVYSVQGMCWKLTLLFSI